MQISELLFEPREQRKNFQKTNKKSKQKTMFSFKAKTKTLQIILRIRSHISSYVSAAASGEKRQKEENQQRHKMIFLYLKMFM